MREPVTDDQEAGSRVFFPRLVSAKGTQRRSLLPLELGE